MSHFNIVHTHATISVALKALSLSFSLSGCSDLSPNPTDIPALPERGTTTLMHSNLDEAQHFCVYSCFFICLLLLLICETTALLCSSWNRSFVTIYCKNSPLQVNKLTQKVQLHRYNHGIYNINRHDQDQNNEEPSIPCASARQKMNPVKKIKRQIKCLWVTPQRPCWTLASK